MLNGIPEPVRIIWQALNQASPTFLVGGAVRDWLLHELPHDYDFASALPPGDVAQWAKLQGWQAIPTGLEFGTVTLRHPSYQDWPVEVTTFRKDGRYKDGRHPAEVHFSGRIEDDLGRRDFTMNAMALAFSGVLIDPFGGQDDLDRGLIVTVGRARQRFAEDPLRMWRAVRFVGKDHGGLPFRLAPDTCAGMTASRPLILNVSGERQRDELMKLLASMHFAEALEAADGEGLLGIVWPEWAAARGFAQHNAHHAFPVHTHLLATAAQGTTPLLRLAGLLHDIGKPECFTQDACGTGHFYGHDTVGAVYAERMLQRLKFDAHTVRAIRDLVAHHMYPWEEAGAKSLRRVTREWGLDHIEQLWELRRMDIAGSGTQKAWTRQPEVRARWEAAVAPTGLRGLKPVATGKHVMEWTHLPQGPEVGQWMRRIQDWVDEDPARNTVERIQHFVIQGSP